MITDDVDYAKEVGDSLWGKTKEPEKQMKEKQDEEERKQREEEEKKRKEEEGITDFEIWWTKRITAVVKPQASVEWCH